MSYIELINSFWKMHEGEMFCTSDIAIYFWLLDRFNKSGWRGVCKVSNLVAAVNIGITENTLKKGRDRLKKAGLIDYRLSSKRNSPTEYFVKDIVSEYDTNNGTEKVSEGVSKIDTQNNSVSGMVSEGVSGMVSEGVSKIDTLSDTLSDTLTDPLLKDKTILEKKRKEKSVCVKPTLTHAQECVSVFYGWVREYAPWCAHHMTLPNRNETERLVDTWTDETLIRVLKNLENHKGAREKSAVMMTTLENWLEKDEKDGKAFRRSAKKAEEIPKTEVLSGNKKIEKTNEAEAEANFKNLLINEAKYAKVDKVRSDARLKLQKDFGIVI